jgi:hypothetical protein
MSRVPPPITDYDIATAMTLFGGNFIASLGRLWMVADQGNQATLKAAFAGEWDVYRELVALKRQRKATA